MKSSQPTAVLEADPVEDRRRAALATVQTISAQLTQNAGAIKGGDPAFCYLWVFNHPQQIDRYLGMQYAVVNGDDPVTTTFKRSDGTHVRGDTILMRVQREIKEAWDYVRDQKANERLQGAKEQAADFARGAGMPTFQPAR